MVVKSGKALMVTIVRMSMVVNPARSVVHNMGHHYQHHRSRQYPVLVAVPYLLGKQQHHAYYKYTQRPKAVVVLTVAMPQRKAPNPQGYEYHDVFKQHIVYDVPAKYGQGGQKQGQQGAVNGAGQRSSNAKYIPVYFSFH